MSKQPLAGVSLCFWLASILLWALTNYTGNGVLMAVLSLAAIVPAVCAWDDFMMWTAAWMEGRP